jgi:putative aldouronate transport system substrate-binding protein
MWLSDPEIITGNFSITSVCKYPEAAIRFADFFYTEKGSYYSYYGPPANSPDLLGTHNGWYFNDSGAVVFDRSGTDFTSDENYRLGIISGKPNPNFGNNDFQSAIEKAAGQKFIFSPNARAWRESMDKYVKPYQIPKYPVVYFDAEKNDRVLELTSTVTDYMTMMDAKFITGSEPLGNIPAYLARVKTLGADELEKIYQDAYSIYKKNLSR